METTAKFELSPDFDSQLAAKVFTIMASAAETWGKHVDYPQYMDKQTAAKYLQVSMGTLNSWINHGLEFTQVKGVIRLSKTDLDSFMKANKI
ncbi:helix-turn-helix domain-containing protein [Lacticaseibacillus pabuli]|uniref:Helix-turn-helix domain-containing protein n=1 Tax=Lacticaseibacillus pabuli TaxID=3025672 RepID=A0ABY7WPE9_9LACO|nr:helix-turn-helix domain-containing protein [Lacticaseibacillus sp. KACC 23028]WDF82049.1 helix-turn-helix domain-containing protein [Lacticaseibacillus sp. KACC 23028]